MILIIEWVDKDIKIVNIIIFYMFKKEEEMLNWLEI